MFDTGIRPGNLLSCAVCCFDFAVRRIPYENFESTTPKESEALEMTDEELDRIIQLLLTDASAGLKAYAALTVEQKKQVIERAQDERINQIVAEADAESITD